MHMHMRHQPSKIPLLILVIFYPLLAGCAPWVEPRRSVAPIHATPTWASAFTPMSVPTSTCTAKSNTPGPMSTLHVAGELHLAVREDVKTLNPYLASNASEEFIVSLLYDTLLSYDLYQGLQPNLAERWELASDGFNLTCWLNPQARWHDGQPVTAEDVVFSVNLVRQKQVPGLVYVAALIDRVEAINPSEVRFALLTKRANAVRLLGTKLRIVPARLWENVDDPLHYPNLDNPIGSGPFLVVERAEGKRLVLRNTSVHHCTRPSIDTLVLEILRDEDKALKALKDGELDALGWDVTPEVASKVRDNSDDYAGIKLGEAPGTWTYTLLLNLRKAPYDSHAFRQALAQALDLQAILDAALMGFGDAATPGLFPPASGWQDPSIMSIAFDPQQAIKALETAGFVDRNGDGLRENPNGSGVEIPIACAKLPIPMRVAEMVAANWQAIGIAAKVMPVAQELVMPALMQAQFDVILHSISLSEPEMAFFYFHTSCGLLRNGRVFGFNYGGFANPEYDKTVTAAQEEQNPAKQQELLYQLQEMLAADLPQNPLYIPHVLNLYRDDRFVGWVAEPGLGLLSRKTMANLRALGK